MLKKKSARLQYHCAGVNMERYKYSHKRARTHTHMYSKSTTAEDKMLPPNRATDFYNVADLFSCSRSLNKVGEDKRLAGRRFAIG
jgi:hypothetical protein